MTGLPVAAPRCSEVPPTSGSAEVRRNRPTRRSGWTAPHRPGMEAGGMPRIPRAAPRHGGSEHAAWPRGRDRASVGDRGEATDTCVEAEKRGQSAQPSTTPRETSRCVSGGARLARLSVARPATPAHFADARSFDNHSRVRLRRSRSADDLFSWAWLAHDARRRPILRLREGSAQAAPDDAAQAVPDDAAVRHERRRANARGSNPASPARR